MSRFVRLELGGLVLALCALVCGTVLAAMGLAIPAFIPQLGLAGVVGSAAVSWPTAPPPAAPPPPAGGPGAAA